jgi:Tfp pilus assembly protein PilV
MKRSEAGDTIVEVMIAIVVISTVLSGAFLVSRTSLKHVRDSEEHSQALKLVQGQVELLRDVAAQVKESDAATAFPSSFCMSPAVVAATNAACTSGLYKLSVKSSDAANHTYQATARWDSVSGGTAQVQLSYRVVFAAP